MFESPGVRKWRRALQVDESTLNLGEVGMAAEKIDQLVCKAHTREIQRATVVGPVVQMQGEREGSKENETGIAVWRTVGHLAELTRERWWQ